MSSDKKVWFLRISDEKTTIIVMKLNFSMILS